MSQCWPEGALRAYLDRELPPEDMHLVAAHLGECADCEELSKELAGRAARVGAWLEALPEVLPQAEPGTPVAWVVRPEPRRATAGWRWIGLAAALAAGLVWAALLAPRRNPVAPLPAVVDPGPLAASTEKSDPPVAQAAPPAQAAHLRRVVRAAPPRRKAEPPNPFLALDDEPIDTGVVVRVGVEPGNVQADIVFGPDGRAHAIRLVNARN